ncbi:hypothetical protein QOZ80_7BG0609350 [Eleusine coracana subsp. coracana]|nr:hypothetical protein QOZ80_7BG0609350 [Eleusine coracana subsp. coracana]
MPKDVTGEEIIFLFSATGKMITLMSSDGKQFKMPEAAARLSSVLADMIDDKGFTKDNIPLPHVPSHALATVIKYCDKHAATAATKPNADHNAKQETLEKWDRELLGSLTSDDLLDLVKAANFLDIKGLELITCEKIANMIKGKSPEQLRKMFHVVNDFTKEEEEEIRRESSWAFPCNN